MDETESRDGQTKEEVTLKMHIAQRMSMEFYDQYQKLDKMRRYLNTKDQRRHKKRILEKIQEQKTLVIQIEKLNKAIAEYREILDGLDPTEPEPTD